MKRRIMLPLLLLAGALVNVAVAWTGSYVLRPVSSLYRQSIATETEISRLKTLGLELLPEEADRAFAFQALGSANLFATNSVYMDIQTRGAVSSGQGGRNVAWFSEQGWPMRALWCEAWRDRTAKELGAVGIELHTRHSMNFKLSSGGIRPLAFGVLWPGFAINTLFYAGILWLLFAAPFALRKRRRIKHGLCPKCAYDLRGRAAEPQRDVCPECGHRN